MEAVDLHRYYSGTAQYSSKDKPEHSFDIQMYCSFQEKKIFIYLQQD